MRTLTLALGCIAAVVAGTLLASRPLVIVAGVSAGLIVLALIWLRSCMNPGRAAQGQMEPLGRWQVAAATLLLLGFVRGASVGPPEPPRMPERGWTNDAAGGPLREFEVVGASEPGVRCVVELRAPGSGSGPGVRVSAPPEQCPLAAGDRVAVSARALGTTWRDAMSPADERDLGDGPAMWRRPGPTPRGLDRARTAYWHRVASLRQRAWSSTRGDPQASLVVAVALGLRSALAPEQREELRAAGLGHLIAVSGLHVAVAALWLQALVRRGVVTLGGSPRWACVIAWVPLWAYVGLTGAAPSAIRAAVMLMGIDLAILVGRPTHGPTLLACTAAAMLLGQPSWVLDPGFALSISAMAAIVTAPRELGPLATSWRITWATAPVSVLWFDVAPLHGLLGNAVALPMFALLMPLALVATLAPGGLGSAAMLLARLGAAPILDLAALLAELPSTGPTGLLVLALVGLGLHRRRRRAAPDEPAPAWLPGKLACVLAIVVGLTCTLDAELERRRVGPLEFDWVAVGSVHSRSLLVADPSAPASACLYRPTGSAATWRPLLELLEVRRLARVEPRLPGAEQEHDERPELDPASRSLIERLERSGVAQGSGGGDDCRAPPPERVREALRACRSRQAGRGRALARSRAGVIACRIDDRWVVAAELL